MTTVLYTHPICLEHDAGPHHPERPARLEAVLTALASDAFAALERLEAPRASHVQLARVHDQSYIEDIFAAVPARGHVQIDPDTAMSPSSGEAALRAAGAAIAAVDRVLTDEASRAFCAVRPPGHHAEPARAMGFCLFNNVAVAAAQARAVHGIDRVAAVDFDVHHGNGTQTMFESDAGLFYASTHQSPNYPGTGDPSERGVAGNIVNAVMSPGDGSPEFRAAMTGKVLPALRDFGPELVLISAGFDAHMADPLAQLNLTADDFAWATAALVDVAEACCAGRVVSVLEGGYDLAALAECAAAHVRALMGS